MSGLLLVSLQNKPKRCPQKDTRMWPPAMRSPRPSQIPAFPWPGSDQATGCFGGAHPQSHCRKEHGWRIARVPKRAIRRLCDLKGGFLAPQKSALCPVPHSHQERMPVASIRLLEAPSSPARAPWRALLLVACGVHSQRRIKSVSPPPPTQNKKVEAKARFTSRKVSLLPRAPGHVFSEIIVLVWLIYCQIYGSLFIRMAPVARVSDSETPDSGPGSGPGLKVLQLLLQLPEVGKGDFRRGLAACRRGERTALTRRLELRARP